MNPLDNEATRIMIPIIRKYIPNRVMSYMAGVPPMDIDKEDVWKMCIAIEMMKKHLP